MIEQIFQIQSYFVEVAKQTYQSYYTDNFTVFLDKKESLSYFNYAIPTKTVFQDFSKEYNIIQQIFMKNDRTVRFEFLEDYAPSLPSLLLSVGLREEYKIDLMLCTESDLIEQIPIDKFKISELTSLSSTQKLKEFKMVQELSFNESSNLCIESIETEDVLERIGTGGGFICYLDNIAVSTSQYTSIINGIAELVNVATLPDFRNKGLGSALSARATRSAFENGAEIVCLTATDEIAARMYSKIGFRKIATMLAYS